MKKIKNSKIRVIFHGEGDSIRGTGHLVRSIGMAIDFKKHSSSDWLVEVFTNNKSLVNKILEDWKVSKLISPKHFQLDNLLQNLNWSSSQKILSLNSLCQIRRKAETEILITDNKYSINSKTLSMLYQRFDLIFFIDNVSCLSLDLDGVFFPNEYSTFNSTTVPVMKGAEWVWLNPKVDSVRVPAKKVFDYSIFMGGADPNNCTLLALDDLNKKIKGRKRKVVVIIGPAFQHLNTLKKRINDFSNLIIELSWSRGNFLERLSLARLCLIAFGLTSIELEFIGKHVVLYTHNEMHLSDAKTYLENSSSRSILRDDWLHGDLPLANKRRKRPNFGGRLFNLLKQRVLLGGKNSGIL